MDIAFTHTSFTHGRDGKFFCIGVILLVLMDAGYGTALVFDLVDVSRGIRKFCLKCCI